MYSANIIGKQMDTVYGLYLPEYEVPSPEAKTNYKEIPFMDGAIDKTAPDGIVHFMDRNWELEFQKTGPNVSANDIQELSRQLNNDLHGRKGEIIFDDDPNYKWIGRVFVQSVSCENNGLLKVAINLTTEPYKYNVEQISVEYSLSEEETVIELDNGRKPTVPSVIVSDEAVLTFTIKGVEYSIELAEGTWNVSELVLFEGTTEVIATGSGTITFEYEEASL